MTIAGNLGSTSSELADLSFLSSIPLFAGLPEQELEDIRLLTRPFEIVTGQVLFRQGTASDGMYLIETGLISIRARVPGDEEVELNCVAPGGLIGELAFFDRGLRSASAVAIEPTRGWFFANRYFEALRLGHRPAASSIMNRLTRDCAGRVRRHYGLVAECLRRLPAPATPSEPPAKCGLDTGRPVDPTELPASLADLHVFSDNSEVNAQELIHRTLLHLAPRGTPVLIQGQIIDACFIVVRGAVRTTLYEGGHHEHMSVAGPGKLVGELGLIDGKAHPASSVVKEQAILLELTKDELDTIRDELSPLAFALDDAVNRSLVHALRRGANQISRFATERVVEQSPTAN